MLEAASWTYFMQNNSCRLILSLQTVPQRWVIVGKIVFDRYNFFFVNQHLIIPRIRAQALLIALCSLKNSTQQSCNH